MYRNEREHEILKLLSTNGYTTVKELSHLLFASESSIRRDLTSLEHQGAVRRSYGGVELTKNDSNIIPFFTRTHHNIAAKKIIAQKASRLVQDGDIIFLDQSSSAFFVAQQLVDHSGLTVVTNNIEIVSLLSQTNTEVISSGGRLSPSNRNCLIGNDAYTIFNQMHANIAFFSAKALSSNGTIFDCSREEICVRNAMLSHAEKKVFLCTTEKIGKTAGYRQCSLDDIDLMISEKDNLNFDAIEIESSFTKDSYKR